MVGWIKFQTAENRRLTLLYEQVEIVRCWFATKVANIRQMTLFVNMNLHM